MKSDPEGSGYLIVAGIGLKQKQKQIPCGNDRKKSKSNSKGWLSGHLLSHVSDDEAVASVGHPGGCAGVGEEREEANPFAALRMTTRKARATARGRTTAKARLRVEDWQGTLL